MTFKTMKTLLLLSFLLLFSILITVIIAVMSKSRSSQDVPQARSFVKEPHTGLVTVMDSTGNLLCTFYDSVGAIGHFCPDTVYIYPKK